MYIGTLINNVNFLQFSKTCEFISILLSYCARKFCFIVFMIVPHLCNWCTWKMRSLERHRFTRRIILRQALKIKVCGVKTKVTCFRVWTRGGLEWYEVVTKMLMKIQIFRDVVPVNMVEHPRRLISSGMLLQIQVPKWYIIFWVVSVSFSVKILQHQWPHILSMCSYRSVPQATFKEKTDFCGMCVKMIAIWITPNLYFLISYLL